MTGKGGWCGGGGNVRKIVELFEKVGYTIGCQRLSAERRMKMAYITLTTENFDQEVLKADRPVLVDFWAGWCGPCMALAPTVDEIAAEQDKVKVGKVNVDEQQELARQYRIMSIPTLMLFENGEMVRREVGGKSKEEILEMIGLRKQPVRT